MPALLALLLAAAGLLAAEAHAQDSQPAEWRFESQRADISPRSWRDAKLRYQGAETLALAGDGKSFSDGRWTGTMAVEPDAFYRFRARYRSRDVEEPGRSVLARLLWQDSRGKTIGEAEYPATRSEEDAAGWRLIEDTYRSPAGAASAKLELVYRWDADGAVNFAPALLTRVAAPAPRLVRLGAVRYRPTSSRTPKENMERFAALIGEAAAKGADVVTLPEAITLAGTGQTYVQASEPIEGPTTKLLGELARKHGIYIVAGILERDGAVVYNTAVLLGRDGKLAGRYRKVSLPREEIDGGITPGDAFPTFDTDFGRIGIMICWDVTFPEPARALALAGAEVILMPIWGGNTLLARARAVENQVYLVSSSYDMETGIFDKEGTLVAEASDASPVAVVEVDLNERKYWKWLGDFRSRIPREMPGASASNRTSAR